MIWYWKDSTMFREFEYPKVFVYRGKEWQTGNLLFRPEHGPSIKVRVNERKLSLDPNMTRQSSGLARAMPWVVFGLLSVGEMWAHLCCLNDEILELKRSLNSKLEDGLTGLSFKNIAKISDLYPTFCLNRVRFLKYNKWVSRTTRTQPFCDLGGLICKEKQKTCEQQELLSKTYKQ